MEQQDIHDILQYLPHRYPFLLLDRVLELHPGERIRAMKNVTVNEPFFAGHFPNRPVMPGVLILEALAQASAYLAARTEDAPVQSNRIYLFAGVDKVRFKKLVEPGDTLVIDAQFMRKLRNIWKCSATASVDDSLVCAAELLFTYRDV